MAIFGKNGQATSELGTPQIKKNSIDFNQMETTLHQLAEKIKMEKEKNGHLIQAQQEALTQLQRELSSIEEYRNGSMAHMNSGSIRETESLKEIAKTVEELNDKILEKKRQIARVELDIAILVQEKDEKSLQSLFETWKAYETQMFNNLISPIHQETVNAKLLYFEKLKELRGHYNNLEKLAVQINQSLEDGNKVTVHTWFNASQHNPELLITKYDEEKEDAITHTYRAE